MDIHHAHHLVILSRMLFNVLYLSTSLLVDTTINELLEIGLVAKFSQIPLDLSSVPL